MLVSGRKNACRLHINCEEGKGMCTSHLSMKRQRESKPKSLQPASNSVRVHLGTAVLSAKCYMIKRTMLTCWWLANHKCQPHGGARGQFRRSTKTKGFILWAPWWSVPNFMAIVAISVWTNQPTDTASPEAMAKKWKWIQHDMKGRRERRWC